MARYLRSGIPASAHEDRQAIGKALTRMIAAPILPVAEDSRLATKMTLPADTVARFRIELRGIHDGQATSGHARPHARNVFSTGAVTPLAGNAAFR